MDMRQSLAPLILLLFAPCLLAGDPASTNRPADWAEPAELEGVPNFHKINETLYRSAQPTAEGMKNLEEQGFKTIVNLRGFHSDKDELQGTSLQEEHIRFVAWNPEEEDFAEFLRLVTDEDKAPVLVHCLHGADRTGAMCAIYRVAVEGWTKEDAIKEMTEGGYGFHKIWVNIVPWIEKLDIEALKKEAGLTDHEPEPDEEEQAVPALP